MSSVSYLLGLLILVTTGTAFSEEMRGLLIFGHEERSLQMCGDNRVFWVHAPGSIGDRLKSQYQSLVTDPYESVYVELDGKILDKPVGSFAANYDGTLEIKELKSIAKADANACQIRQSLDTPKPMPIAETRTYVFECGQDTAYTVRTTHNEAWVFRPKGTLQLAAVAMGEGVKYTDGTFELWIEGEQARFGETGNELLSCHNNSKLAIWEKAKLNGADFRAVGNEPGWHLEIQEGSRILLIADYGASRVELPLPEPTMDSEARITRWDAGELILEVIGHTCRDTMSDESFEATVVVTWGERTLMGCGRALH